MAKKTKKVSAQKQAIEQITSILDKMSDRLVSLSNRVTAVGNESAQTSDKVNAFLGRERIAHAKVQDAYSAARGQDEINRETTKSLYTLRDHTKESFENVASDVRSILQTAKRAAERIEQVENQNASLLSTIKILEGQVKIANDNVARVRDIAAERIKAIEERAKYYEEKLDATHALITSLFVGGIYNIKGKDSFGEFTYIHPLDLGELINKLSASEFVTYSGSGNSSQTTVTIGKTRYKQSPYIPRRPGQHKIV